MLRPVLRSNEIIIGTPIACCGTLLEVRHDMTIKMIILVDSDSLSP